MGLCGKPALGALIITALLLFFVLASPAAQEENRYKIKVVTVGPGDEIYSWWGHISFIVEDTVSGRSRLYDYGQFAFEAEDFIRNFIFGHLWFSVGRAPAKLALNFWASEERDMVIQELNLSPEKELELIQLLEYDNLPENQ